MCVRARAHVHFGQTWPKTTRIDILFEMKHNKTHRNTVQEEQGVILKVNKQKRRAAEVLVPLSSQRRGEVGPCEGASNVGFSNSSLRLCCFSTGSVAGGRRVFAVSHYRRRNTSHCLFVRPLVESLHLQVLVSYSCGGRCRWGLPSHLEFDSARVPPQEVSWPAWLDIS